MSARNPWWISTPFSPPDHSQTYTHAVLPHSSGIPVVSDSAAALMSCLKVISSALIYHDDSHICFSIDEKFRDLLWGGGRGGVCTKLYAIWIKDFCKGLYPFPGVNVEYQTFLNIHRILCMTCLIPVLFCQKFYNIYNDKLD